MYPFGLHSVEPRALLGQQTADDPHPLLLALFQSPVALADPPSDLPAYVPTCVVPDQHQHLLADGCQLLAAPLQKARGYTAHRTTVHKAQPRIFELGYVQSVAGDGLRVGVVLLDRLLYKTKRLAFLAKAVQVRLPHSAPPALVLKADHPIDLLLEGPIDGVRAVRTSSQRLLEALLVDLVDGIACGLRIAAKIVGDLIGVLSIGAGKQDLATT